MLIRLLFVWVTFVFAAEIRAQTITVLDPDAPVGIKVAPNNKYDDVSVWKQVLMGKNYRNIWGTEVYLPVFHLSRSGFSIVRLGGSKQTNSLYLSDSEGKEWVLRSVDKNVKRGIPGLLQITPFTAYKQQLITATHPYAAAIVAKLIKPVGSIAPDPQYYYVADDTALGQYRELFAGTTAMLEKVDLAPVGQVYKTDTLLEILSKNPGAAVHAREYLKVRLLDMIVGDWDRHPGNWLWWSRNVEGRTIFYPIPRDRDHALFDVGGIIPFISKMLFEPYLSGFRKPPLKLKKLNKKALELDRAFLKSLSEKEWMEITKDVVDELDDDIIKSAVFQIPDQISVEHKEDLIDKLISRRDHLPEAILGYYHYLFR